MSEINVLHPFREGNGRTIREFARQLLLKNGYYFNLHEISPKEMLEASIRSVVNPRELGILINQCLVKKD